MPNIIDDPELYVSIVLLGTPSPGQVTLSGHDRKITWDVKAGQSLDGASITRKAVPPGEFTASFYLVKDVAQGTDDLTAWEPFHQLLESISIGQAIPTAPTIYHPDLARNKITSVVVSSIGGMVYDGKGGATVVVKFQEYRPPKKKGGTIVGSPKTTVDPNADLKTQLNALTNRWQATPWG
jgi:hypothetical protein